MKLKFDTTENKLEIEFEEGDTADNVVPALTSLNKAVIDEASRVLPPPVLLNLKRSIPYEEK